MKLNLIPVRDKFDINNEQYKTISKLLEPFGAFIAGGAARQIFLHNEPAKTKQDELDKFGSTDIDCYFYDIATADAFEKYYKKHYKLSVVTEEVPKEHSNPFYAKKTLYTQDTPKIQIMTTAGRGIKKIFRSFDFHCCCFAVKDGILYYTDEAAEDALNKQLRYFPPLEITDGVTEWKDVPKDYRVIKYILKKGYTPSDEVTKGIFERVFLDFCENGDIEDVDKFLNNPNYRIKKQDDRLYIGDIPNYMHFYVAPPQPVFHRNYFQGQWNAAHFIQEAQPFARYNPAPVLQPIQDEMNRFLANEPAAFRVDRVEELVEQEPELVNQPGLIVETIDNNPAAEVPVQEPRWYNLVFNRRR